MSASPVLRLSVCEVTPIKWDHTHYVNSHPLCELTHSLYVCAGCRTQVFMLTWQGFHQLAHVFSLSLTFFQWIIKDLGCPIFLKCPISDSSAITRQVLEGRCRSYSVMITQEHPRAPKMITLSNQEPSDHIVNIWSISINQFALSEKTV